MTVREAGEKTRRSGERQQAREMVFRAGGSGASKGEEEEWGVLGEQDQRGPQVANSKAPRSQM